MPCALWVLGWVSENWDPLKGTWRLPCVTFSGRGVTNAMLILMSFLFVHVSCLWFFTSMHVLNFLFWVRVICINNEIGIIVWLGIVTSQSLKKGTPWKFWLDPWFPRNSKPKWTLKWLPLDRGYFKFCFLIRRKSTNNLGTCVFLALNSRGIISSHSRIVMHFILVEFVP